MGAMTRWLFLCGLLVAAAVAVAPWAGGPAVREAPDQLGQIVIVGNIRTPNGPILEVLELYPGMLLPEEATLWRTEIRLLVRFHNCFDLATGKRPTLKVLPREGKSALRDIEVRFPEQ